MTKYEIIWHVTYTYKVIIINNSNTIFVFWCFCVFAYQIKIQQFINIIKSLI